jgi:hypothetical protein
MIAPQLNYLSDNQDQQFFEPSVQLFLMASLENPNYDNCEKSDKKDVYLYQEKSNKEVYYFYYTQKNRNKHYLYNKEQNLSAPLKNASFVSTKQMLVRCKDKNISKPVLSALFEQGDLSSCNGYRAEDLKLFAPQMRITFLPPKRSKPRKR